MYRFIATFVLFWLAVIPSGYAQTTSPPSNKVELYICPNLGHAKLIFDIQIAFDDEEGTRAFKALESEKKCTSRIAPRPPSLAAVMAMSVYTYKLQGTVHYVHPVPRVDFRDGTITVFFAVPAKKMTIHDLSGSLEKPKESKKSEESEVVNAPEIGI